MALPASLSPTITLAASATIKAISSDDRRGAEPSSRPRKRWGSLRLRRAFTDPKLYPKAGDICHLVEGCGTILAERRSV